MNFKTDFYKRKSHRVIVLLAVFSLISACSAVQSTTSNAASTTLVKKHFQDSTEYTHYSLMKTISKSRDLPYLGHAGENNTALILAPGQN